ncbi:MAG: TetR/AcrR family transcriptional regulator [Spirochaetes bacterium]|nr:TetR/AcrR family transcriptional regulator [Spirochaetota bacterium]
MAETYTDTETRKEQIVDAIMKIMASQGMVGLTVKNIAEAVGIVPSAIYRHFPGKGDMIDATLAQVRKTMAAAIANARVAGSDPLDTLRIMFETHVDFLYSTLGAGNVFITTEIASHFPEKRKAIMENMKLFHGEIRRTIARGQEAGCIRDDLGADELTGIYTGLFMAPVMMHNLAGNKKSAAESIKKNWDTFLRIARS